MNMNWAEINLCISLNFQRGAERRRAYREARAHAANEMLETDAPPPYGGVGIFNDGHNIDGKVYHFKRLIEIIYKILFGYI